MGKIKRKTKLRKFLRFYRTVHGFRDPYKVILDGNFVSACVHRKLEDTAAMHVQKFLGAECKIFTTRAVRKELESMGKEFMDAANQTHKLLLVSERGDNGNENSNNNDSDKKQEYIKNVQESILKACQNDNRERFIVCTQDRKLKEKLRVQSKRVPIVFCHVSGLQMEPPIDADSEFGFAQKKESGDGVTAGELKTLANRDDNDEDNDDEKLDMYDVRTNVRYKKAPKKGPNPLANLKKKKRGGSEGKSVPSSLASADLAATKKKRKRR